MRPGAVKRQPERDAGDEPGRAVEPAAAAVPAAWSQPSAAMLDALGRADAGTRGRIGQALGQSYGNGSMQRAIAQLPASQGQRRMFRKTVSEQILGEIVRKVPPDDVDGETRRRERLRTLFESVPDKQAAKLHARLTKQTKTDDFTIVFQRLDAELKTELLAILERKFAPQKPPAAAQAEAPVPEVTPVAVPASQLSDTELDQEREAVKERLEVPETYPERAADEVRLAELEAERTARNAAAAERAPFGGLLGRLATVSATAAAEGGAAADTATALADFKKTLKQRIDSLGPAEPLPADLRIVMEALLLWAADKGDQWGEGSWDSKDLRLSASDYVTVPASHNKCNAYVAEAVYKAVGVVHKGHESAETPGKWFPFRAAEWSDPSFAIPEFTVVDTPRMSDVVGFGGHVGIYLGTYSDQILYVSARDNAIGVHGGQHTHGIQIKLHPASDVKTYRRYSPGP